MIGPIIPWRLRVMADDRFDPAPGAPGADEVDATDTVPVRRVQRIANGLGQTALCVT